MSELLEKFKQDALAAGVDELIERVWAPGQVVGLHVHEFDAEALVTRGELWLTRDGDTRRLTAGDTFQLEHGTPHAERYGPEGATYWVARRNPR